MTVDAPNDQIKSVQNLCVIESFLSFFIFALFMHSLLFRGFCHTTASYLVIFLFVLSVPLSRTLYLNSVSLALFGENSLGYKSTNFLISLYHIERNTGENIGRNLYAF